MVPTPSRKRRRTGAKKADEPESEWLGLSLSERVSTGGGRKRRTQLWMEKGAVTMPTMMEYKFGSEELHSYRFETKGGGFLRDARILEVSEKSRASG